MACGSDPSVHCTAEAVHSTDPAVPVVRVSAVPGMFYVPAVIPAATYPVLMVQGVSMDAVAVPSPTSPVLGVPRIYRVSPMVTSGSWLSSSDPLVSYSSPRFGY